MKRHDGFKRGTGCFFCANCGRLTRQSNTSMGGCCPECDMAAQIENGIMDFDLQGEELADAEARIADLHRDAVRKGGKIEGVSA